MTNKTLVAKLEQDSLFGLAVAYVERLLEQDKPLDEALDHAVQKYGVNRASLTEVIASRRSQVRNSELGTFVSCVATPSTAVGVK